MRGGPAIRRHVVQVCRRLYERGLIAGPDGNVSVRIGADRILVTPAGMSKVDVTIDDLVELSLEGKHLRGARRASSEVLMHLRIYQRRADVEAVVHAHPPTATGFAVAGESFAACVLPEMIFQVGWVPLVPYATPGTPQLADAFEPYVSSHDAFLMANHGGYDCRREFDYGAPADGESRAQCAHPPHCPPAGAGEYFDGAASRGLDRCAKARATR